jgi:hypothetical protein
LLNLPTGSGYPFTQAITFGAQARLWVDVLNAELLLEDANLWKNDGTGAVITSPRVKNGWIVFWLPKIVCRLTTYCVSYPLQVLLRIFQVSPSRTRTHAQMERELIMERTRAGLQAARRQGRVGVESVR